MSLVNELLTLDAAQALVLEQARPLPAERVPLAEAAGRWLAETAPEGADAVIQHEHVVETDNRITIADPVGTGVNIRPVGRDVIAGAAVVQAGVRLGPAQIGALAAAGVAEVA